MKGLDDHITRFMYGRAAAQCTSCDAANIPLRRRVLFGPVDQQSVVSSDRVGLFMPPSVSRLASAHRKQGVVESSNVITNAATCKTGQVPLPLTVSVLIAKARHGGGHIIYSAGNDMPSCSALLTTLARSAWVHIYCDGENCGVLASGNAVWVHAIGPTDTITRSGQRVITLPEPLRVTNEAGVEVCVTEACTIHA